MLELKKIALLADEEYEEYDENVVKLSMQEQAELGLIKTCCGTAATACPKVNGRGSCCGSKKKKDFSK